ncbi:rho guanine nucleotide exchange factor 28-like isoform X2 [Glandiceps talaboti]
MGTKGTCRMAFSPQSSPIYGGKTIVVAFADENSLPVDKDLYLIFEGSQTRHVTSVNRLNAYTLQAVIPGHDRCEVVQLSVCIFEESQHQVVARGEFTFMDDPVHHFARWLIGSVYEVNSLDDIETIIHESGFDYRNEDKSTLDLQLTSAFENLSLPQNWNIVGDVSRLEQDPPPRETLLHFATREGLTHFASLLLNKPGGDVALCLPNKNSDLPMDLARERGLDTLMETFQEYSEDGGVHKQETDRVQTSTAMIRKHNIGTATISTRISEHRIVDDDIKKLQEITTLMKSDVKNRLKLAHTWSRVDEDENEITEELENSREVYNQEGNRSISPSLQSRHINNGSEQDQVHHSGHTIPTISVTDPLDNSLVLEESLRRLHDLSEGIQKKREHRQTLLLVEDLRKESLSRLSTSCPSLADSLDIDPFGGTNIQPANSMVTVSQYSDDDDDSSPCNLSQGEREDATNANTAHSDSQIRIYVNDVTVDSSCTDYTADEAKDTLSSLDNRKHSSSRNTNRDRDNHGWGAPIPASPKKKKPRRHSWCPVSEKVVKTRKKSYEEEDTLFTSDRRMSSSSSEDDVDDSSKESSNGSEEEYHDAADTVISHTDNTMSTNKRDSRLQPRSTATNRPVSPDRPKSEASVRSLTDVGLDAAPLSSDNDDIDGSGRRRSLSQSSLDSATDALLPQQPVHKPIQKAVSVGAIHMMKDGDIGGRPGIASLHSESSQEKSKEHDQTPEMEGMEHISDEIFQDFLRSKKRTKARMSLTEFLSDPRNFGEEEEQQVTATKLNLLQSSKSESEKKSSSLSSKALSFLRMPSTRPRNKGKDKDNKNKTTHQFMTISFSNSTKCDYCEKSLVNKDALQCQVCSINVHDSSCKDNMGVCSKLPKHPKQSQRSTSTSFRDRKLPMSKVQSASMTTLQSSQSFSGVKERPRSMYIPAKPGQSNSLPASYSVGKLSSTSPAKTSSLGRQRRELFHALHRQHSSSSCGSQPISEENEVDLTFYSSHAQSNISETISVSMESLDETADDVDFDDDPDLMLKGPEPESWSVTVDKKTLKKMSNKDIKRQDVIFELIQTEKHHVRTLKIMQKIFVHGMQNELHMDQSIIDKMFPMLGEIIEINTAFLDKMKTRQSNALAIDKIGDVLVDQFADKTGDRMKVAYGIFCAHQREAVTNYKDLLKSDRKFQSFIKKCSQNALCRRWSIPECILAVTHRLTKYPLLIEAIIKNTKASRPDYQQLQKANTLVKNILNRVDAQVKDYEREQRQLAIYNKIDARSSVLLRSGKKFKKSDILANNRKLRHEGEVQWHSARGKHTEVQAVLLTDVLIFLQDNNGKYSFLNLDQKSAVVPLQKLMVRNVATDKQSIYLISPHKPRPEMYEIMFGSTDERNLWKETIEEAVKNCPDEDEGVVEEEIDEERKQAEARAAKINTLLEQMQEKDQQLDNLLIEKWKILLGMTELVGKTETSGISRMSYRVESTESGLPMTREILLAAVREASRLTSAVYGAGGLCRSATSVGESESATYHSPLLPKRAETFGGFDSSGKEQTILPKAGVLKKRFITPAIDSETRSNSSPNLTKGDSNVSPNLHDNRRGSATRSLSDADKKEAARRRDSNSSTGSGVVFPHGALQRNASDSLRDEREERLSDTASDRGSTGELSTATDSGVITQSVYVPPTVEQVSSVAHLTQYLNSLLFAVAQRDTEFERMRMQLTNRNSNRSTIDAMKDELERKKEEQRQKEEQLKKRAEELRYTEQQLQQEREDMVEEKDRHQKELEEQENRIQREKHEWELYQIQLQDPKLLQVLHQREGSWSSQGSQGETSLTPATSMEALSRTVDWVSTSSDSVYSSTETLTESMSHSHSRTNSEISHVSSYAGNTTKHSDLENLILVPHLHHHMKPRAVSEPIHDKVDSVQDDPRVRRGSDGKNLPIHLYSATNEGRQVVAGPQQQLPMKLMSKEKGKKKQKEKEKERGCSPNNNSAIYERTRTASPTLPLPGSQVNQLRNVAKPGTHAPHTHGGRTSQYQRSHTETVAMQVAMEKTQLPHQQSLPTHLMRDPSMLSRTLPTLPHHQQTQQFHHHHHHQQQQQQHQQMSQHPQQQQEETPPSPDQEVIYF